MTDVKKAAVAVAFYDAAGVECAIDENPTTMHLFWGDDEVTIVTEADIAPLLRTCAWHGAKQKLIDGAAIARNPETGRSASVADKRDAVLAILGRMAQGEWFARRGEGAGAGTLLLAALMRFYPDKPRATLETYLAGLEPDAKRNLERNPRIAPIIEAIRTERKLAAGSGNDGEDDLAAMAAL